MATATREAQVTQKLGAMNASLDEMEKTIDELSLRLIRGLRPGNDAKNNPPAIQDLPEPLCDLATEIQDKVRRIEFLRGKIYELVNRLEL